MSCGFCIVPVLGESCSDALGRLTQVFEPDASNSLVNEADYQYDALGNLLGVAQKGNTTDANQWRSRNFVYDSLSRLTQSFNPESGLTNYTYDANGNLVSKAQPRAINILPTITYCYDALNRLTSKSFSAQSCPMPSPDVIYNYDQASFNGHTIANGIGRRTSMTDGTGLSVWSYDTMGRTVNEWRTTNGITKSFAWLWKQDGSLGQVTYPDGSIVTTTAGGAGRPLGVTDSAHSIKYALNLKYAPTGQIATAGYGLNGGFAFAETNTYNNRLQPSELKVTGTASVLDLVYGFGFGVNDNGNVLTVQNEKDETSNRDQTFTYDPMNRLATAQTPTAWGIGFSYDAWGNLYQTNPIAGTAMNPQTFSTTPTINNQLLGYGYDGAGNLINDGGSHSCAGATVYTYDAENRMTCAAGYNFTYDGDGTRVSKSSGTMYWGGGLAESDLAGNLTAEYVMLNGKRIARRDLPSGLVHYYFSDHLGSSNIVASQTGVIENESDYYPFGGEHIVTQNLPNQHFKFTGKERDAESNLDYFGARYYSSTMGRFASPDWRAKAEPIPYAKLDDPQNLNLYAYVGNNPLTRVDADGHIYNGVCDTAEMGCQSQADKAMDRHLSIINNDYDPEGIVHDTIEYTFKGGDGSKVDRAKQRDAKIVGPVAAGSTDPSVVVQKIQYVYDNLTVSEAYPGGLHGGNFNFDHQIGSIDINDFFKPGRNGIIPSVHVESRNGNSFFHIDAANGTSIAAPIHWTWDVFFGTYVFKSGLPQ